MKKICISIFFSLHLAYGFTQHVGIGVSNPSCKLEVRNLQSPYPARFTSIVEQSAIRFGHDTEDYVEMGHLQNDAYIRMLTGGNFLISRPGTTLLKLENLTGRLGLGTLTPNAMLHIEAYDEPTLALFKNETAHTCLRVENLITSTELGVDSLIGFVGVQQDRDFSLRINATDRLIVKNGTGFIGLGTNTPGAPLHVTSTPAQALLTKFINAGDHAKIEVTAQSGTVAIGFESNQGYVGTTNNRDFNIRTNGVNRLFVRGSDGFVGIGTNAPAKPLTIRADANQDLLQFQNSGGSNIWHWWMPNGELDLTRSGVQNGILRIDDIGFVGINTVNPQARLHVGGDLRVEQPTFLNDDLTVIGPVLINNSAVISGPVTMVNDVTISQNTTIGGTLTVTSIAQNTATAVSYENGFSNHGGSFGSTTYYKDKENRVHLSGMINIPGGGSGTMFTLPVGYRPPNQIAFAVLNAAGGTARVDINTSGQVILEPGYAGPISVSGVSFRTLQ